MTYDIENLCSGFGQAQKCGGVKPIIVFVVFWFFFSCYASYTLELFVKTCLWNMLKMA